MNHQRSGLKSWLTRQDWLTLGEIVLVIAWACWICRDYFNFDLHQFPRGTEVPMVTQTHYIWSLLPQCGACMLWNGSLNGGAPAFADTYGAILHPLTILTTLLLEVINGNKILIICGLAMGGLAQWWLGRVMGFGRIPRLWAAGMAVIGGNLVGRMENGGVILLFSMAACSLALAPAVDLALTGRRRSTILLGVTLALAWVSGHGYAQIAMIVAIFPCFLILLIDRQLHVKPVWKEFGLALLISILLAGILWAPVMHFFPNFVKDGDPYLSGYTPLQYLPLNLVIPDFSFFSVEVLGHTLNLYHYFMYIGWVPVILAVLTLHLVERDKTRLLAFFFAAIGLIYLVCSADFMKFVDKFIPQVGYLRYFYIVVGLAAPFILTLSAWSVDILLKKAWPAVGLFLQGGKKLALSSAWLLLGIPLILAFKPGLDIADAWLGTVDANPSPAGLQALSTPSSEWVNPPFGAYQWVPFLLQDGAKLANVFRPWSWAGRESPKPVIEAIFNPENKAVEGSIEHVDDVDIVPHPENEYAFVQNSDGTFPCKANARGGVIDVTCTTTSSGQLVVHENTWSGWYAWVDGKAVKLGGEPWLNVAAPAGTHTYSFRYLPWDVALGALISLAGVAFAVWLALPRRQKDGPVSVNN